MEALANLRKAAKNRTLPEETREKRKVNIQ